MSRWLAFGLPVGVAAVALVVVLIARDPEPDLEVPPRDAGQVSADLAGILDGEVDDALQALADDGWDAVALTFETPAANQGEAQRGGRALLEDWDADIVLVAVAEPGDFDSDAEGRRRFFGVEAPSAFDVPGDLREDVTDRVIPPYAADNDWTGAFRAGAEHLAEELEPRDP